MASDSGFSFDLSLHLENLIPGAAILGIAALSPSGRPYLAQKIEPAWPDFAVGTFAIALAYIVGTLVVVITRFFIDGASKKWVRWRMLKWLCGSDLPKGTIEPPGPEDSRDVRTKVLAAYDQVLGAALRSENGELKTEIIRRRQQGRIVRATTVPALMLLATTDHHPGLVLAEAAVLVALFVLTYAFCEAMVYQEAALGFKSA